MRVDAVDEIVAISQKQMELPPADIESEWQNVVCGVCRLSVGMLMVLDIRALLEVV